MGAGPIHHCHQCGAEIAGDKPGRRDACPGCGADLHVCKNCRFWDPSHYNECREPQAERVLDRERANFCDWFAWREGRASAARGGAKGSGMDALEQLFKKS